MLTPPSERWGNSRGTIWGSRMFLPLFLSPSAPKRCWDRAGEGGRGVPPAAPSPSHPAARAACAHRNGHCGHPAATPLPFLCLAAPQDAGPCWGALVAISCLPRSPFLASHALHHGHRGCHELASSPSPPGLRRHSRSSLRVPLLSKRPMLVIQLPVNILVPPRGWQPRASIPSRRLLPSFLPSVPAPSSPKRGLQSACL